MPDEEDCAGTPSGTDDEYHERKPCCRGCRKKECEEEDETT